MSVLPTTSFDEQLAQALAQEEASNLLNNNETTDNNNIPQWLLPFIIESSPKPNLDMSKVTDNNNNKKKKNNNSNNKKLKIPKPDILPKSIINLLNDNSSVDLSNDLKLINPNIHELFLKYNLIFFNNLLNGIEVKWSKRMTLCAGLCVYEGMGGLCSIRLSEPLLKYRTTKELIETLIHECIHAYLFIKHNNRDRDGHGDCFKSIMNSINYLSHLNITIYHTFYDEVDNYRKHIWKCNGPCQHKAPYFGLVKRAINRAPSSRDPWWNRHSIECGGTYTKISQPDNYKNKSKTNKNKNNKIIGKKRKRENDNNDNNNNLDIRQFFKSTNQNNNNSNKKRKLNNENNNKNNKNNKNILYVNCPICKKEIKECNINNHIDKCII